jgi:predicted ABC-type ATPase
MNRSGLLVISGPPGAGKSTTAGLVAARFERSVLVEQDSFFGFIAAGGIAPWLPGAHQQNETVTRAAAAAAGRYVSGGFMVVYDGLIVPRFLHAFADEAGLGGFDYVILLPHEERCVQRVATRQGHGFTDEEETRHMHREFVEAEAEPRYVLRDPPDDPSLTADRVIELLADGSIHNVAGKS